MERSIMTTTQNRPIPFQGTPEEAEANIRTHAWFRGIDEIRCGLCDAKTSHMAAKYPCGVDPPREIMTLHDDGTVEVRPAEYGESLF